MINKITAFVLILALLACCTNKNKKVLQLNLKKGETYYQTTNTDMTIIQKFNQQQIKVSTGIFAIAAFKVIDANNTVYNLEVTYKKMSISLNLPNGTIEFSSYKNSNADIYNFMNALIDKPFYIKLTKKGKIIEVNGIDSLINSLTDILKNLDENKKEQVLKNIRNSFGEDAIKASFERITAIFPDDPVKVGDTWKNSIQLKSIAELQYDNNFELKEANKDYYLIACQSINKTINDVETVHQNGMNLRYNLTGNQSSEIKIDPQTGWIKSEIISEHLSGKVTNVSDNKLESDLVVPMEIYYTMKISDSHN